MLFRSIPTHINNGKPSTKALGRLPFKCFHRTPSPRSPQDASAPKSRRRRSRRPAAVSTGTSLPRHQKTPDAVKQAAATTTAGSGATTTQMELASRVRVRDVLGYQDRDDDESDYSTERNARQLHPRRQNQPSQLHSPKQWFTRRRI